jgi:hypothetical protein
VQFTIAVTNVNEAPSGTDKNLTISANTAHTFTTANFGYSDSSDSPPNTFQGVVITTLPANGTLLLGIEPVTVGQFILAANITAGNLKWAPEPDASGPSAQCVFTFQVQDNGGVSNGGINLDPTPNTMTIDVTP